MVVDMRLPLNRRIYPMTAFDFILRVDYQENLNFLELIS